MTPGDKDQTTHHSDPSCLVVQQAVYLPAQEEDHPVLALDHHCEEGIGRVEAVVVP